MWGSKVLFNMNQNPNLHVVLATIQSMSFLYDEQTRLDSVIIVIEQIIKWIWKLPKEQLSQEWNAWHKIGYVSLSFQTTFRTKNTCKKTSVYHNEYIKFKSVATIKAESFFSLSVNVCHDACFIFFATFKHTKTQQYLFLD